MWVHLSIGPTCCHGIQRKDETRVAKISVKACCHGKQKKGEKSGIEKVKTRCQGIQRKERKVAGSAQGCCHGIQRKGEKSDLVSSRVLSRDTEIRREKWFGQLKGGVGTGYWGKERKVVWSAQGFYHGILRKGDKSGWGKSCCQWIVRKGAKICIGKSSRVITGNKGKGRKVAVIRVKGMACFCHWIQRKEWKEQD